MVKVEERDLVLKFKKAKDKKSELETLLKEAKKEFDKIESRLIELLEDKSAEASAKYEGIGYVRVNKPRLYASCNVGDNEALFKHLIDVDQADMIKESVHPGTLSTYVKECIEQGNDFPEFVNYYFKTSLRLYK